MNTSGLSKQFFNWLIWKKTAFEKNSMDLATGNPVNEGSFKTAYFGWSFHFKQPYNEGGDLGTSKEYGKSYLKPDPRKRTIVSLIWVE